MVDANHAQWWVSCASVNVDRGLVERGVDVVDGEGVVGVGGVARDVNNDAEATGRAGGLDGRLVEEGGNLGGEVDAVDKDVDVEEFLVRAMLGRSFLDVPANNVLRSDTGLFEEVDRSTTATAECADYECPDLAVWTRLFDVLDLLFSMSDESVLVGIGLLGSKAALGTLHLLGEREQTQGGTCKACMPAECGNPPAILVLEKLKIVQLAAPPLETRQHIHPTGLLLEAVRKLDVGVRQIGTRLLELLEADDGNVGGKRVEGVVRGEFAANIGVLLVVKNALGVGLDSDVEASVDEGLGGGRGERGAVLGGLHLAAEVEGLSRSGGHDCGCRILPIRGTCN